MNSMPPIKHFTTMADVTAPQLDGLLRLAARLKASRHHGPPLKLLRGRSMAMLFTKPSLRTRVSFELAMLELGGESLYLSPAEVGLGQRESVADVARVLSRYVDVIMARVFSHDDIRALAAHAGVPVINGLSDLDHPCQALADLLTIEEAFGSRRGRHLVYIGDGNNVAHALAVGGALSGMRVTLLSPPGYALSERSVATATALAGEHGGRIETSSSLEAAAGADVLYTDVWTSMGQESEQAGRRVVFRDYQVNAGLLERASPHCIVLHCLPAHRGEEITDDVIDGPRSRVFDQAENRLHAQKALLAWMVGGEDLPASASGATEPEQNG